MKMIFAMLHSEDVDETVEELFLAEQGKILGNQALYHRWLFEKQERHAGHRYGG